MPKKAFLVEFAPRTRVIVDIPDDVDPCEKTDGVPMDKWHEIVRAARDKMARDIGDYLYGDNVSEIIEDTECPFGTFSEDNE